MNDLKNSAGEAVRAFMDDALIEGDPQAVDRYFAEDVEYVPISRNNPELTAIMPWIGLKHGLDGVKGVFGQILENVDVLEYKTDVSFGEGESAAAFGTFKYRAKKTGRTVDSDWAIHAAMRDGKIVYFHFYEDSYVLASAFRHGGGWDVENHLGRGTVPDTGRTAG